MTTPSRSTTTTAVTAWLLKLTTRFLAHSLNMPEPLLHHTGALICTRVKAVEHRAAKTLCPIRLLRAVQALLRQL